MSEPIEYLHVLPKREILDPDKLMTHLEAIYGRNNFKVETENATVTVRSFSRGPENLLAKLNEMSTAAAAGAAGGCSLS
ncbi:hypothetical protein ACJ41O_001551 [Fusarium nematophilum]